MLILLVVAQMILTLHTAFEYLARIAVFVEQARIGENLAFNENVSFEDEFRQLEDDHEAGLYIPGRKRHPFWGPLASLKDDHEAGLYWLLCALHRVIFVTGTTVSQEVIEGVMSMRVLEVDRNALRHTRDYIVLRDFERLLERLAIDFASLRDLRPIFWGPVLRGVCQLGVVSIGAPYGVRAMTPNILDGWATIDFAAI